MDLVIDSKGTIDTDGNGYTVEVAIPFASLRYERAQGGASSGWGLHVQRFIRRDHNEQISWMPLSRIDRACSIRPARSANSPTSTRAVRWRSFRQAWPRTKEDPDYAVKLTGKQGPTTMGVLYADDGVDGAKKGAFRLKRDFGRESTVGATMTTIEC